MRSRTAAHGALHVLSFMAVPARFALFGVYIKNIMVAFLKVVEIKTEIEY